MNTKFKNLTTAIIIVALLSSCRNNLLQRIAPLFMMQLAALISDKPNIVMIVSDDIGYEIPTMTEAVLIPIEY